MSRCCGRDDWPPYGHPAEIFTPGKVREIFGVPLYRLPHPHEQRILPSLDIVIGDHAGFVPDNPT